MEEGAVYVAPGINWHPLFRNWVSTVLARVLSHERGSVPGVR